MIEKQKNIIITKAQTLAVILVVAGHSFPSNESAPYYAQFIFNWLYSFHMPFFIFLSGFLFRESRQFDKFNYFYFVKGKSLRLLVPYFILSFVAIGPKSLLSQYSKRPVEFTFENLFAGLIIPDINPIRQFWFILSIFSIFLILAPIFRIAIKKGLPGILPLTIVMLALNLIDLKLTNIFAINHTAPLVLFFWVGCLVAHYKILHLFKNLFGFAITFISFNALYVYIFMQKIHPLPSFISLIGALMGIWFSLSISVFIASWGKKQILNFFDGYYYQIYLLSWFLSTPIFIVYKMGILNFEITTVFRFFSVMVISVFITKIIVKNFPWAGVVLGISEKINSPKFQTIGNSSKLTNQNLNNN